MSRSKQKGTAWETAVVGYLCDGGHDARRLTLNGNQDRGDISVEGLPVVVEAKNCKATELGAWVDEATVEATRFEDATGRAVVGVVWHHRRGKASPGDGYVTMSGAAFAVLLERLAHL